MYINQKVGTCAKKQALLLYKSRHKKYVPKVGTKVGTIAKKQAQKVGTTKYVPKVGTKVGTFVFKVWA